MTSSLRPQGLPEATAASPCYLNGEYTVIGEAKASVLDRGFVFVDGVYEAVPCAIT